MCLQYEQYSLIPSSATGAAAVTSQAEQGPAPPVAEDPKKDVHITPSQQMKVVNDDGSVTEEKVEYRDENGEYI